MKSLTHRILPAMLTAVFFVSFLTQAAEIRVPVLQAKSDRLYFGAGQEANVFSGSPFVIECGADTVHSGLIQQSHHGISISEVVEDIDSVDFESCLVVITTAVADSHAVIRLGTDIPLDSGVAGGIFAWSDSSLSVSLFDKTITLLAVSEDSLATFDSLVVVYFPDSAELNFSLAGEQLDGYLSYSRYEPMGSTYEVYQSTIPLVAALIPNPSREINHIGALTTSLYYRFDHARLSLYFKGDRVQPVHSFDASGPLRPRAFPFDVEKGRRLFSRLPNRPRKITMYVGNPVLQSVADYFSDILARDRCRTERVTNMTEADIAVVFVPYSADVPTDAFRHVINILNSMIEPTASQSETIETAETQLGWAEADPDSARQAYYLRRVERRLVDDLGVFPLFQPSAFLGAQGRIKGIVIDDSGRLDLSEIRRVQLPALPEGGVE